jgi:hypothetical protein
VCRKGKKAATKEGVRQEEEGSEKELGGESAAESGGEVASECVDYDVISFVTCL